MKDDNLIDLQQENNCVDNLAYEKCDDEEAIRCLTSDQIEQADENNLFLNEDIEIRPAQNANTKANYFIDSLLSAFIFAPLSALYWYGSWSLVDVYLLPSYQLLSALVSYCVGLVIVLPGYIFQEKIQDLYNKRNDVVQFLIRFVYAYLVSLACILEWRGQYLAFVFFSGCFNSFIDEFVFDITETVNFINIVFTFLKIITRFNFFF
jgi:hypothetical protein